MKTNLEKSHSKWSNFKLTILCLFETLFISIFWLSLILKDKLQPALFYTFLGIGIIPSILAILLFNKFKR